MRNYYLSLCLFLLSFPLYVEAQSPGGVDGAELWHMTVPMNTDLTGNYFWKDYAGDTVRSRILDKQSGRYGKEFIQSQQHVRMFNFRPALNLSQVNAPKVSLMKYSSLGQATVIGLFCHKPADAKKDAVLYTLSGRPGSGVLMSKDKAVGVSGTSTLDYGKEYGQDLLYGSVDTTATETFEESALRIVSYIKANKAVRSVWGEKCGGFYSVGSTYNGQDVNLKNAFSTTDIGNNIFDGYSPEAIVFSRHLTNTERLRIESYLGLKYGVTLKGSYLDPRGNLIWDASANAAYHHRVTGIAREDVELLFQPVSTTSYEETPLYSSLHDTYYKSKPYNLSSESRLLVIGQEHGSPIPDGSYMIWGDNGVNTAIGIPEEYSSWHVMNRKWLTSTNIHETADTTAVWGGSGFYFERDGHFTSLLQNDKDMTAVAYSKPLVGTDGSISMLCPFSPFDVGFTDEAKSITVYGYRVRDGKVYSIIRGIPQTEPLCAINVGERMIIRKTGNALHLIISAEGDVKYTVDIPENEAKRIAFIRPIDNAYRLEIRDVLASGFGVTGNVIELATNLLKDKQFVKNASNALLLIDGTGKGEWDPETVRVYRCNEQDAKRGKFIFHNVFFDTDGNGSDVFTFGYHDGVFARLTPKPASCIGSKPQADGSIDVKVLFGNPSYRYEVRAESVSGLVTDSLVQSGLMTTDHATIKKLLPGIYHVDVIQTGGTVLTANMSENKGESYANSPGKFPESTFSWSVSDMTSVYHAGMSSVIRLSGLPDFGFSVNGSTVTVIVKGKVDEQKQFTVAKGDVLSLTYSGKYLDYRINGKSVNQYKGLLLSSWHFSSIFTKRHSSLSNLLVNDQPCPILTRSADVSVETIARSLYDKKVTINSECGGSVESQPMTRSSREDGIGISDDSAFKVIDNGNHSFTAKLSMRTSHSADLMVFDASGQLLLNKQMEGGTEKTSTFTLPQTGVYIVKAITPVKEYTLKMMNK